MSSRTIGRIFLVAGVFGIVLPSIALGDGPILAAAAVSLLAAAALHVVLHEAGHAAAILAMGLRVDRICLGQGRRLFRLPFGHTVVDVHALPVAGFVVPGLGNPRRGLADARRRLIIIWAAGPLVTALVTFFGPDAVRWLATAGAGPPAQLPLRFARDIQLVGLLMLVQTVLPIKHQNDGRVVIELLTASQAEVDDRVAFIGANRIIRRAQDRDLEGALDLPEASDPAPHIRYAMAAALLTSDRYSEATSILRDLASEELSDRLQLVVRIDLAYAGAYSGDHDAIALAEVFTRQLDSSLGRRDPYRPVATVGRGHVLVALGRNEEARALFDLALKRELPRELRGEALAGRALARLGMGDRNGARQDLEQARRRSPGASAVRLATRTIEATQHTTPTSPDSAERSAHP